MLRLHRCIGILTAFCRIKQEVGAQVLVHVERILFTLDEEMAAAIAAEDLFLMRKVRQWHKLARGAPCSFARPSHRVYN